MPNALYTHPLPPYRITSPHLSAEACEHATQEEEGRRWQGQEVSEVSCTGDTGCNTSARRV